LTYIDGKTNIMCLHCVSNRMSSTSASDDLISINEQAVYRYSILYWNEALT